MSKIKGEIKLKRKNYKKFGKVIVASVLMLSVATGSAIAVEADGKTVNYPERPAVSKDIEDITSGKGSTYIKVNDLETQTPEQLVQKMLGDGAQVVDVRYTGVPVSAGSFTTEDSGILGFNEGIILSSGDIRNIDGPNESTGISEYNGLSGDQDLDLLIPGYSTRDATILEFDFIPEANKLSFEYVFSSDEYNEYVGSNYNDVFGFFLNGQNIALIPNTTTPVSINNVNNGNSDYIEATNPEYYIDNTSGQLNTEMDGLTRVLTATAAVKPGQVNTIRLAIADAGDYSLDSNVCIKTASFTTVESDEIQFSKSSYKINENAGTATVTVEREGEASGTVSVDYTTENGSATDEEDYGKVSGTLTFAPGVKSLDIEVPIKNDAKAEGTETANLYLKNIEGDGFMGSNSKARLYIEDDDAAGTEYEKLTSWEPMSNVSTNKNFIVKFSKALNPSTVTPENFYVTDSTGNILSEITPEISYNSLSVVMKTNYFSYSTGETYYLNISGNVKTASGKALGNSVKMPFTVGNLQ